MATVDVNTDYETATRIIAARVDDLHSRLRRVSPEDLEAHLDRTGFGAHEQFCVWMTHAAIHAATHGGGYSLYKAWDTMQDARYEAQKTALAEGKRTGDYRRLAYMLELETMAESSVEAAMFLEADHPAGA